MSKTMKNSLMIIGIVVVSFIIIWFVYEEMKLEPADANTDSTNLADENTGLENIINDLFEEVVTNEQEENVISNNEKDGQDADEKVDDKENDEKTDNEEDDDETSSSETITSKEERAIELVKQEWGGDEGVTFVNEKTLDPQGRYVISVRESRSRNALAWYLVDVETGLVKKGY